MTGEKPKAVQEGMPPQTGENRTMEHEISDEERQNLQEQKSREAFIQEIFSVFPRLGPEQKVHVARYVSENTGPWMEYNGKDIKIVESSIKGDAIRVSVGFFFDEYEAQRVDREIPLV